MRRRGRAGWQRWAVGGLAAAIVFAVSSLAVGVFASASSAAQPTRSAPRAPSLCLPRVTPCPIPTPTVSLPIPTPTVSLPVPTPTVSLPVPTPCLVNCGSPTPKPTPTPTPTPSPTPLCIPLLTCPTPTPNPTPTPTPCLLGIVCLPGTPSPSGSGGCLINCTPDPSPAPGGSTGGSVPGSTSGSGPDPGSQGAAPGAGDPATSFVGGDGAGAAGGTTSSLLIPAPPAVQLSSPVAGISFGRAPFLWPLFVVLDALALIAVVIVLRKTWSKPIAD